MLAKSSPLSARAYLHATICTSQAGVLLTGSRKLDDDIAQLRKDWMKDKYLRELDITETDLVSYAMLKGERELWDLLPSAEDVREAEERHKTRLLAFRELTKALVEVSNQWKSNLGAVRKAKLLESKAEAKEQAGRRAVP